MINNCKEKEGTIKASCHEDVQLEDSSFVGMNRQRKITSPTRPCGQELITEANEGWINVGQSITRVPTPEGFLATHSQLALLKKFD